MDCRVVQELFSPYIDDELDDKEVRQLKAHIESCFDCKQRFEKMKAAVQMVGAIEEEELPAGFADRLRARLESEQVIDMTRQKKSELSKWMKWACVAAAAIIIVMVVRAMSYKDILSYPQRDDRAGAPAHNMSKSMVEESQSQESTESAQLADGSKSQKRLAEGDISTSDAELGTAQQAKNDVYIRSDKVKLKVQDVCITPQTILDKALQHGIEMVDQTENSITLRCTSIEQRKILYDFLELLGVVEDIGSNFESDTVTIIIEELE